MSLENLDTLLGFATVMLGVSLLISVTTQLMAGLFGLRGSNLRWGIQTILECVHKDLQPYARLIAEDVLRHRLISDSKFSRFGKIWRRSLGWWRLATAIRVEELQAILNDVSNNATPSGAALKVKLTDVQEMVESWFERTMDRVSQRFAMTMRFWTVGLSVLVVAILHLDTPALLQQISHNAALRAGLVASADAMLKQTVNVLGAEGQTNVFQVALTQLRKKDPDTTATLTNPPPFLNQETAHLWLRTRLGENPAAPQLLLDYRQLVSSNIVSRAPELLGSVSLIQDQLASAGLQLLPNYRLISWNDYLPTHRAFWGMVASAALLSLGAPFWFNALKSLVSLRPVLAKHVEQETKGEKPRPK